MPGEPPRQGQALCLRSRSAAPAAPVATVIPCGGTTNLRGGDALGPARGTSRGSGDTPGPVLGTSRGAAAARRGRAAAVLAAFRPAPVAETKRPGDSAEQQEAGPGAGRAVSEPSRAALRLAFPPRRDGTPQPQGAAASLLFHHPPPAAPRAPARSPEQRPRQRRRFLPAGRRPTHRRGTRRRCSRTGSPKGPRCRFLLRATAAHSLGRSPTLGGATRHRPRRCGSCTERRGGPAPAAAARPGGRRYVSRAAAGAAVPPRGSRRHRSPSGDGRPGRYRPCPAIPGRGPGALQPVPARWQAGGRGHGQQVSRGTLLFLAE